MTQISGLPNASHQARMVRTSRVLGASPPIVAKAIGLGTIKTPFTLTAKPGSMIVLQPEIPLPLHVRFPFPAWATRHSETGGPEPTATGAAAIPSDPYAGLPGTETT